MFKLETKDDNEADALITESLTCPITVPKFQFIQPKHVGPKQNVSSVGGGAIIIKGAQIEKRQPKEPTAKDHLLHLTKDVQHTKKQAFREHVVDSQKSYASILRETRLPDNPRFRHSHFRLNKL